MRRARGGRDPAAVALEAGIHPKSLARYESGARDPGTEILAALCRALGVSADYLVLGRRAG